MEHCFLGNSGGPWGLQAGWDQIRADVQTGFKTHARQTDKHQLQFGVCENKLSFCCGICIYLQRCSWACKCPGLQFLKVDFSLTYSVLGQFWRCPRPSLAAWMNWDVGWNLGQTNQVGKPSAVCARITRCRKVYVEEDLGRQLLF